MILASFYIADRFGLDTESGFTPIDTPIAWWTLVIAVIGIVAFFVPAYLGIRVGARFATVLGVRGEGGLVVSPPWDTPVPAGTTVYYVGLRRIADRELLPAR